MYIKIHRGAKQIGGCVTEIGTVSTRIYIDMGAELPDEDGSPKLETLTIDGVTDGNPRCDAVFFTHYHGDHIGMLTRIMPGIPMYMGEAAKALYLILQRQLRNGVPQIVETINTFQAGKSLIIGDITVTPFWVDHSAYDAYMFLVEAEGKRILHMGDFRTHGFRGKGLLPTLHYHVGQIDVLITEGTTLSRDDEHTITEHMLQLQAKELLKKYKYVFVACSSTNIDRLAAFHGATPRGKYFVTDGYQHKIIEAARRFAGAHTTLYQFSKAQFWSEALAPKLEEYGFCMPVRSGAFFQRIVQQYKENHNDETLFIYSMWEGYLRQQRNPLINMMQGLPATVHLHTSGHATRKDIVDVCNAVAPKQAIIPIHSDAPLQMDSLGVPFPIKHIVDSQIYQLID